MNIVFQILFLYKKKNYTKKRLKSFIKFVLIFKNKEIQDKNFPNVKFEFFYFCFYIRRNNNIFNIDQIITQHEHPSVYFKIYIKPVVPY